MKIIKDFKKIVIVGGGSAGWMTAAMLIKFFPKHDITVIESPDHPIIGVGESTLLGIKNYCNFQSHHTPITYWPFGLLLVST